MVVDLIQTSKKCGGVLLLLHCIFFAIQTNQTLKLTASFSFQKKKQKRKLFYVL